jgi:DNA-binding ferritin-like protein
MNVYPSNISKAELIKLNEDVHNYLDHSAERALASKGSPPDTIKNIEVRYSDIVTKIFTKLEFAV